MKIVTRGLRLALPTCVLLQIVLFPALAGANDIYAAPNGAEYSGDGSCSDLQQPCDLGAALLDVRDGGVNGPVVRFFPPESGATADMLQPLSDQGSSIGVINPLAIGAAQAVACDVPQGIIAVEGDITIDGAAILTIADNVELHLVGPESSLTLEDGAVIEGGFIVLTQGTSHIQLGDPGDAPPFSPARAQIENLAIDAPGASVHIQDQDQTDLVLSELFILNSLQVLAGEFDSRDNRIVMLSQNVEDECYPPEIEIASESILSGNLLTLDIQEAATGGFANTIAGAFPIFGGGDLNVSLDKRTNAGVRVNLPVAGSGFPTFNRRGSLFFDGASVSHAGSIINEDEGRTEFFGDTTILGDLEVEGPGIPVFNDGISANCVDGLPSGFESGVYVNGPILVEGILSLANTDSIETPECVEGIEFGFNSSSAPSASLLASGSVRSIVRRRLTTGSNVGIILRSQDGVSHVLEVFGDLSFTTLPTFVFESPFPGSAQCGSGNALILSGPQTPQSIEIQDLDPLTIPSLVIQKDLPEDVVEIRPGSQLLRVTDAFEIIQGTFNDNGLLDIDSLAPASVPDSDQDLIVDICDNCPADFNTDQVDLDADLNGDLCDQCPEDPQKTALGECGCGVPETGDTDADGTHDCNEECPNDALKTVPGVCGCGVADSDSDEDGTLDCNDQCPNDASKLEPGECGCGIVEADLNENGVLDCEVTRELLIAADDLEEGIRRLRPLRSSLSKKKRRTAKRRRREVILLLDPVLTLIAESGAEVSLTDQSENIFDLGSDIETALALAVRIGNPKFKRNKRVARAIVGLLVDLLDVS